MKRILCLLCAAFVFSACEKSNEENDFSGENFSIYSRYIGTFQRTGMDTVEVRLGLLSDNRFEGSSTRDYYPAICGGYFTYDETDGILVVDDTCAWTANFDWSLIFDGTYRVDVQDKNTVRIWRSSGGVTDEYRLKKLVR